MLRTAACLLALATALGASEPSWWTAPGAHEHHPNAVRPAAPATRIALVAPINGVAHAQVAVRASASVAAASGSVGELRGPGGAPPAGSAQVRWLTNADLSPFAAATAAARGPLTTISDRFVPGGPLAIAYVGVAVPPGTTPGRYAGQVELRIDAASVAVPIEVEVADVAMPARSDLDLAIALMQSPAQLAFAYRVPAWSPAHWTAIERSVRLLGDVGHHITTLPVLWHANAGSGPQAVVFRRDGDRLIPDLSRVDRLFRIIGRECGPQRWLVLGVWGRWLSVAGADKIHLTELTADGRCVPLEWTADYAAHETMWKQVYDGVAELALRHLGVPPERIVLGLGDDDHPSEEVDAVWRRIAPRTPGWEAWTHNYDAGRRGPRPAYFQIVDTEAPASVDRLFAWPAATAPVMVDGHATTPFYLSACRDVQSDASPAVLYYSIPDLATAPQRMGHCAGFARMGLDFWRGKRIQLVDGTTAVGDGYARDGRDGRTFPGRVARNYRGAFTAQGPDGALPMIHFDALREGVQAAQARILVVRAAQARPEQAEAARAVIELQFRAGARHSVVLGGKRPEILALDQATLVAGWSPLFAAAGQAQRALGLRQAAETSAAAERTRRQAAP